MDAKQVAGGAPAGLRAIPRGIWALGLVSLFMDLSSELIHSLLPVFMVTVLGASAVYVGIVEGIAEATASITKVFSGFVSDQLGKRKALVVIGYGLAALTKPMFALAPTIGWVLAARFTDRIGKGIRGAPRDALVAELAPLHLRGASYGLRQSLDTIGAFAGPLLAIALMALFAGDIRMVFWFAVIPAFLSVAIVLAGVKEPEAAAKPGEARPPVRLADLRLLPAAYWAVVVVGGVLTLARFSEAFLVLRADSVGLGLTWVPLVLVVMSVVYSASAYPAGVLADRIDRRALLALGFAVLVLADVVLALASGVWMVMAGVALWGLHMGLTQGLLATLIADASPASLRGSAFGIFNFAGGIVLLIASVVAGYLWDATGPAATFFAGAGFTALGLLGLTLLPKLAR
ncbi:MAG: MFS transporter [Alphaproteobacteria bacterium]|nr:MFS transporter [Alphaproteobacteria bacterium]